MGLRVLHILDHSLPLQSGYTYRTLAILREQRALGWETFQLTTPKQGPCLELEEEVEGWHFFRTPPPTAHLASSSALQAASHMLATHKRIAELLRTVRPQIIHAHSPVLNALPALWAAGTHVPVLYEVRALWEDAAVDHGTTREMSLRYRLTKRLETFALGRSDHVVAICDGLRRDIISRGISPEKVSVVPNAVDVDAFRPEHARSPAIRQELGLEHNTVLGFIGSFYAYEGLDILIDALARLLPHRPDVRVLLVGGGSHEPQIRRHIAEQGLQRSVLLPGRVPNDQVSRYYAATDVMVYPRRSMRLTDLVTPLKPLEAMAHGNIVIASDVGGHRELIRDGATGFLFAAGSAVELANTIESVLSARAHWPVVTESARRFVEQERTWRRSVAGYVPVYTRLVETAQARRRVSSAV